MVQFNMNLMNQPDGATQPLREFFGHMSQTGIRRRELLIAGLLPAMARAEVPVIVCMSEQHRGLLETFLSDYALAGVEESPDPITAKGDSAITYFVAQSKAIGQPAQVRAMGELYILAQAMRLGGLEPRIEYVWVPNYARALALMESGRADVIAQTVWRADGNPVTMRLSEAVVPEGRFTKGLYTAEARLASYNIKSAQDLRQFTIVSNPRFKSDWAAVQAMPFKAIQDANSIDAMQSLVLLRNVDFMLGEWSVDPDLRVRTPQGVLAPVKGVKVSLPGSRHYAFSAQRPNHLDLVLATNRGLALMQRRKLVERFFTEMGTYRKEVERWVTL